MILDFVPGSFEWQLNPVLANLVSQARMRKAKQLGGLAQAEVLAQGLLNQLPFIAVDHFMPRVVSDGANTCPADRLNYRIQMKMQPDIFSIRQFSGTDPNAGFPITRSKIFSIVLS
jgi:hypothetical protein